MDGDVEQGAVTRLMEDASSLVAEGGPFAPTFAGIGDRLRWLAGQPGLLDDERLASLHGSSASAAIIGEHMDGSVLMLARFPADGPTPVHNHNSWGVVCVVRGRDRYERWTRLDDGSRPDHADLRLVDELTLDAGDVVWFGSPPQDLHAQQGIGDAAWELVYFGRNPNVAPRAYFDPRTGAVTYETATR